MFPTTINTEESIFLITLMFGNQKKIFCNLHQIEEVIKTSNSGAQKFEHFWYGKFVRISKNDIKEMLKAHKMNADFIL